MRTITFDHFADLKALRERLRKGRTRHYPWRGWLSRGKVSTIAGLQSVTSELAIITVDISAQTDSLARAIPKFQEALACTVRVSAETAISSVREFGSSLVQFSAGRTTAARTRGLALRSQRNFRTVHEQTREALVLATDLSVEITYLRTRTEDCSRDVNQCRAIADKFAGGAEAQLALVQERIAVSQGDCARAVEAYNSARRHQSRCEDARLVRNFLTFGIGEVFDIGKFTRSVENSERTMYTAQANRRAAEAQQDSARVELEAWHAEQRTIEDVSTQLEALGSALALAASALDEHRARLADVVNAAFDVSVFFGGLVARTAPWDVITSAPALIAAVVKLQRELDTNAHLTGLFITSPAVPNDELKRLADSNDPPDELM